MSRKWKSVPLGSVVTFLSGGTPRKSEPSYWDGDIPWVSSGEMTQRRIFDTELRVTAVGASNGTKLIPENTVLVVVRGMSLAKEFRVSITKRPVTFNQDLKALRTSESITDEFLFYFLLSQRNQIRNSATEASHGTKKLETRVLEDWPTPLPDTTTQKAIADILSAYDDLIENNRRRMALLEESARLLYREWFVHLRFPGHEHVPITDGVPEGWERKKIGDVSVFLSRGITPKYDDDAMGLVINQKCIRNNRVSLDQARRQSKEVPPAKLVRRGDVLVNSTGEGTLGRVAQLWVEIENCTVDSHVTIVRPADGIPVSLFGATLCALEDRISQMGRGATNQTELSRESLAELPILLPPRGLVEGFEEFASDASTQVSKLSNQIDQLKSARDLLLPRLMNGELNV